MAFENRVVEHPGRVVLTPVTGETNTYDADYTSAEGTVTQEGTLMNADGMNEAVQDIVDASMNGITLSPNGTLTVRNIQCGTVYFPAQANTTQNVNVTFSEAFENAPHITMCPQTTGPQVCFCAVSNITTTGFTAYFHRTNNYATTVHWIAIGS